MTIPVVDTLIASPKAETCIIRGNVVSSGTNDIVRTGFYFGVSSGALNTTYDVNPTDGVFNFNVPDLSSGTNYYYNAWAQNAEGVGSGIASGFTTGDFVREPRAVFNVAWNKQLSTDAGSGVGWFRLDYSTLDGPDILASKNYLEDETITDIIGAWDTYDYANESAYVIGAEGYTEMRGDINQAIMADADVILSNSPDIGDPIDAFNRAFGRYTIRENKNTLLNPSFEFVNIPNWTINTYGVGSYTLGNTVMSGLYSMRLYITGEGYDVSDAGDTAYNGSYGDTGVSEGYPYYTYNGHYLYYVAAPGARPANWQIDETFAGTDVTGYYKAIDGDPVQDAILGDYTADFETAPGPTVTKSLHSFGDCSFDIISDPITVTSGLWYTGSIYAKSSGTAQYNLGVVASGLSGNISSGLSVDNQVTSGDWTRSQVSYQMPTGVRVAYMHITTNLSDDEELFLDCGQFEEGHPATGFDGPFIGDKVLPKRPAKILVNTDGQDYPQFAGVTETIEPNFRDDQVHIYMHDLGSELEGKELNSAMYKGLKTSQAVELICGEVGLTSGTYVIDEGERDLDFMWFQEGSAWYYLSNIAEAEGGRIFFDNEGILTFHNYTHATASGITSGTKAFDFSEMDNLDWRVDKDNIKNHIVVKSTPREVLAHQLVYTHGTYETLLPGETKEVWARITDADRNNEGLPCMSIKEPVGGASGNSTYSIRPNSDGTGADRDSDVTLTSYFGFAESARINFRNDSVDTLYITTLQLYASPAKVTQEIYEEAEDAALISVYGRQTLQIENNFINSRTDAQNLAIRKLIELKDPKTRLRVSTVGDPSLAVGDIVTVQDSRPTTVASGTTQDLMVKSIRWSILDEFKQDIVFEKVAY